MNKQTVGGARQVVGGARQVVGGARQVVGGDVIEVPSFPLVGGIPTAYTPTGLSQGGNYTNLLSLSNATNDGYAKDPNYIPEKVIANDNDDNSDMSGGFRNKTRRRMYRRKPYSRRRRSRKTKRRSM